MLSLKCAPTCFGRIGVTRIPQCSMRGSAFTASGRNGKISMVNLETKAVFFDWPFDPCKGKEVRFYHQLFGRFNLSNWGGTFRVTDNTKSNYRGGPDDGVQFNTLREALEYIHDLVH